MTFAQTRLLAPKTLPSKREADSSTASVVIPLVNTTRYKNLLMIDAELWVVVVSNVYPV